jgi:hypothetical protein
MVSLIDIVPQTKDVETTAAGWVELRGLGLRHVADLLVRFPELRKLMVEGAPAVDVDRLITDAPDAVAAIIAVAARQPEAAAKIAEDWPVEDVMDCLIVVRDLTMPNGVGPFMERIARLVGGSDGQSGKVPAMNTPPQRSNSSHQGTASAT